MQPCLEALFGDAFAVGNDYKLKRILVIIYNGIYFFPCDPQHSGHLRHTDGRILQLPIFCPILWGPVSALGSVPLVKRLFEDPCPVVYQFCFKAAFFDQIINGCFAYTQQCSQISN